MTANATTTYSIRAGQLRDHYMLLAKLCRLHPETQNASTRSGTPDEWQRKTILNVAWHGLFLV